MVRRVNTVLNRAGCDMLVVGDQASCTSRGSALKRCGDGCRGEAEDGRENDATTRVAEKLIADVAELRSFPCVDQKLPLGCPSCCGRSGRQS